MEVNKITYVNSVKEYKQALSNPQIKKIIVNNYIKINNKLKKEKKPILPLSVEKFY